MSKWTSVRIADQTLTMLKECKRPDESHDELLTRLLEEYHED